MQNRSKRDRRQQAAAPRFPFRDSARRVVREDRRKQPDRRLYGISTELLEADYEGRETGFLVSAGK